MRDDIRIVARQMLAQVWSNPTRSAAWAAVLLGVLIPSTAGASVTYGYDPVGRIATALYDNGSCTAYTYDANGNPTLWINFAAPQPSPTLWGSGTWGNFTWSSSAQMPVWGSGIWGCLQWTLH
jgi:YD repeat-containing protein